MDSEKALLLSLIINYQTLSVNRNEDEKQLAVDITSNENFNNQTTKLFPNNAEGTHSKSIKVIENVESFFYLYTPYPAQVEFITLDNIQFTLNVENIVLLPTGFQQIIIRNLNTEQALTIKVIYS